MMGSVVRLHIGIAAFRRVFKLRGALEHRQLGQLDIGIGTYIPQHVRVLWCIRTHSYQLEWFDVDIATSLSALELSCERAS